MSEPSAVWVFTDLDDTLFQSKLKCGGLDNHIPAANDKQGRTASFSSTQQQRLMKLLREAGATLIPVTGRNQDAFDRLVLDEDTFGEFRVLSHGAVISQLDGKLYAPWRDYIDSRFNLFRWEKSLLKINALVIDTAQSNGLAIRSRVIIDHEIPAYISIKTDVMENPECLLRHIYLETNSQLPVDIKVHINGRNMALLAPYSCKAGAVTYVAETLGIQEHDLVIGMGDSLSDIHFLRKAHFGLFPVNSQIDRGINS